MKIFGISALKQLGPSGNTTSKIYSSCSFDNEIDKIIQMERLKYNKKNLFKLDSRLKYNKKNLFKLDFWQWNRKTGFRW